jgi:hypothetical protein
MLAKQDNVLTHGEISHDGSLYEHFEQFPLEALLQPDVTTGLIYECH